MTEPDPGPWGEPPRRAGGWWPWLAAGGLIAALIVLLMLRYPEAAADRETQVGIAHRLLLLVLVGGSVIVHWRARPGQVLKYAALWLAIGCGIFLIYVMRGEALALRDRLVAELMPEAGMVEGDTVSFYAQSGGHFVIEAEVDGAAVHFLLDTGASDVVLSPNDARRLGYDVARLSYTRPYGTANGRIFGAPIRLARIAVGPIVLRDVPASVNGAAMNRSLLGMSFLKRLKGFAISGDKLTLKP